MEAISHAGTCLGIAAKDGIVMASEKRTVAKLLETASQAEKIYKLDECVTLHTRLLAHHSLAFFCAGTHCQTHPHASVCPCWFLPSREVLAQCLFGQHSLCRFFVRELCTRVSDVCAAAPSRLFAGT